MSSNLLLENVSPVDSLGRADFQRVRSLLSRADIVVRPSSFLAGLALLAILLATGTPVLAQQYPPVGDRQYPLNQMTPPGTAAQWAVNAGRVAPNSFQPVRVALPSPGKVTFYETWDRPVELEAPAQAGLLVGRMYRLKITGLEDFEGVEFFPSIELIDRNAA